MENTSYKDYNFASLTEDEIKDITDLESTIHVAKQNQDIILIAYEHKKSSSC